MPTWEIQERCDLLLSRYQKYEPTGRNQQGLKLSVFLQDYDELYNHINKRVDYLMEMAETIVNKSGGTSRKSSAQLVTANAKLKRGKKDVWDAYVHLQALVGSGKRITKNLIIERTNNVAALAERVAEIPDEVRNRKKIYHKSKMPVVNEPIHETTIHVSNINVERAPPTEEALKFRNAWERARRQQNEKLDAIALGLDKIEDQAMLIGEEIDRQQTDLEGVEERVDHVQNGLDDNTSNMETKASQVSVLLVVVTILLGFFLTTLQF
eukprot:CAMPEP_0117696208 /NCGR_PEP_ID=MMETSP0804-20121206/28554_1 /TAXON_ID=1074897 /ORGANISM="Tetraselmis astigmatica, Strain CCMP880" /LENGTH=266 /DNA_ID=CAMNT_0005510339 /DNA_START=275 /DNA_END=1075 /DNA_ORIENTATION=+